MAGTKEIRDILNLVAKLRESIQISKADDGKITLNDWPNFIDDIMAILPAVQDADKAYDEFLDIDQDELIALFDEFFPEVDVSNEDKAKTIRSTAFYTIMAASNWVKLFTFKKPE